MKKNVRTQSLVMCKCNGKVMTYRSNSLEFFIYPASKICQSGDYSVCKQEKYAFPNEIVPFEKERCDNLLCSLCHSIYKLFNC